VCVVGYIYIYIYFRKNYVNNVFFFIIVNSTDSIKLISLNIK